MAHLPCEQTTCRVDMAVGRFGTQEAALGDRAAPRRSADDGGRARHTDERDEFARSNSSASVVVPGWNLLVDHLVVRGMTHPDRLGLGLDVDGPGALIGDHGVARAMYAVGSARRGDGWEVTAVPDLRIQVKALAEHLSAGAHSVEVAG